jgi:hypothetical protein
MDVSGRWHKSSRVWRILLVGVLAVFIAGCDGGTPTPVATPSAVVDGAGNVRFVAAPVDSEALMPPSGQSVIALEGGVDIGELELTPEPTGVATDTLVTDLSAYSKIDAAEQSGSIDHDTTLLLKVLDTHELEGAPLELRGEEDAPRSGEVSRNSLVELVERYDSLPAEVRVEVDGLLERPTEQGSFWYQRAKEADDGLSKFESIDAGDHIRLWYAMDGSDDEVSAELAQKLADEVTETGMWETEQEIMQGRVPCSDEAVSKNGGDGRLDMYLMPDGAIFPRPSLGGPGEFHAAGLTIPQARGKNGCPYTTYILLNTEMEYDYLRSAMAHELFHAYQFSFAQKVSEAYFWWSEASATWVEDVVYPTLNEEWGMLRPGRWANYDGPIGPVDKYEEGGYAQYGAYIWPLFLTSGPVETPGTLIGEIYEAGEKVSPMRVMSGVADWEARFKQFALWNWNKWPAKFYSDHGKAIGPLTQKAGAIKVKPGGGPVSVTVQLEHSSMRYYAVALGQNTGTIGQISFDISDLAGKKGAGVQAIIVTGSGGSAEGNLEDWSDLDERNLCFQENAPPAQIILVVSNSQIGTGKLTGKITARASSEWCPADMPTPESTTAPIVLPGLR